MSVYLKDVVKNEIFSFKDTIEAEEFCDKYENPNNLLSPFLVYCDGAGWNGKISRLAYGCAGNIVTAVYKHNWTNNEAEYRALLCAIGYANEGDIILCDSQLIVYQVLGKYKINNFKLKELNEKVDLKTKKLSLTWIPRGINEAGKVLEYVK